jgi:hypothetical protein
MEPMTECDSIKGGGTIWTDWRLPLLECIRDPGKTTDKKVRWQVLKYTSLDADLYRTSIDIVLLKCLGEEQTKDGSMIRTHWGWPLLECIRDPRKITDKKVKHQVLKYMSLDADLYRTTIDIMLLKCLGEEQAKVAVWEVRDGICGAHQSAYKMNWLLWRAGFYWPTMMDDCVKYQKGCEAYQRFRNIQLAHASAMNSVVKPWPFRGWGLYFIGTDYLLVWSPSNSNNQSRAFIHVTPI